MYFKTSKQEKLHSHVIITEILRASYYSYQSQ